MFLSSNFRTIYCPFYPLPHVWRRFPFSLSPRLNDSSLHAPRYVQTPLFSQNHGAAKLLGGIREAERRGHMMIHMTNERSTLRGGSAATAAHEACPAPTRPPSPPPMLGVSIQNVSKAGGLQRSMLSCVEFVAAFIAPTANGEGGHSVCLGRHHLASSWFTPVRLSSLMARRRPYCSGCASYDDTVRLVGGH